MEVLWTPWRMEYILSNEKRTGCIFCAGDNREDDEERLILYVGSKSMVIMNKYPYANGHLLVCPIKHCFDLNELEDEEHLDLMAMVNNSILRCRLRVIPEGFWNSGIT